MSQESVTHSKRAVAGPPGTAVTARSPPRALPTLPLGLASGAQGILNSGLPTLAEAWDGGGRKGTPGSPRGRGRVPARRRAVARPLPAQLLPPSSIQFLRPGGGGDLLVCSRVDSVPAPRRDRRDRHRWSSVGGGASEWRLAPLRGSFPGSESRRQPRRVSPMYSVNELTSAPHHARSCS